MSLKRKIFNIFAAVVMAFGSMPMSFLSAYADGEPAGEAPKSLKTVKANGDGTYDITLEIEGVSSEQTEATKANVVVVLDTSGSMSGQTPYGSRLQVAKDAINGLASQLLSHNDPTDEDLKDMVEIAFVDFSTHVKTNTTHTTPTTNLNTFSSWVNAVQADGGTNWEAALNAANNVSFGDNDKTYIVFVSDGDPTYRDSRYGAGYYDNDGCRYDHRTSGYGCTVWGNGQSDPYPYRNYDAAKDVADVIVADQNKELYAVGAFGNVINMQTIGGTYYDASDKTTLESAFADIVDKITKGLSVADLQISDGITAATSTEVEGTAGNFRYNVPDSWGSDYTPAVFENGSVVWNPGHNKTLTNGEKASVTFTVWPSQEAMDCIASIKNDGACEEANLEKFGLGQNSDGSYRLITNSTATFKYRTATKIDGSDETTYSELSAPVNFDEQRDPTTLPENNLEVTKLWADGMDPSQRDDIAEITLKLKVDNEEVRTFVFNKHGAAENEWQNNYKYAVAPGVMKKLDGTEATEGLRNVAKRIVTIGSDEYAVLEEGHDYLFDESYTLNNNGSNHYHITKKLYHPMIVDDDMIHDVVFSEDGKTAEIEEISLTKLSAENTLNGGILVGKVVINNGEKDTTIEDKYEITISLTGAETGQYRIYTYNDDGSVVSKSDKIAYSNGTITEKIKVNQKIMVTDVPTGTTFDITEELPDGYARNKVDYELVKYDGTENEQGVHEVFGNTSATATVTNYLESGNLKISKEVTATNGDLQQAQNQTFDLTVKIYKNQGDATPVRTENITIKHDETKEINNIPAGWYYEIVEAAKPGFNEGAETTKTGTIEQGDNEVEFKNNYAVSKLNDEDAKIVAIKKFASGYEQFWLGSDQFEFQLIGNGEVLESKNVTLSGDTAEFVVNITDAGTYKYTITEKTKNEDGSSAFRPGVSRLEDDKDIEVTIVTRDKGDGTLELVSKTYSKISQTIYNKYEATSTYGVSGELKFNKVLEGRDWESSDKFIFTIESTDGPLPETTEYTVGKDHKEINFGTIEFTNEDVGKTYNYIVKESFNVPSVEPADDVANGISFTITVTDNQDGTLNLEVSEHGNTFTNIYKTTSVSAAKVWDDEDDRDGLRKNYTNYYVAVKNDEGKFVAYDDLALENKDDYEFTNLPEKNADGTVINYEIVEAKDCSGAGASISCTEFEGDGDYVVSIENNTITNKHAPELYNETGELTVQKLWSGKDNELARPETISIELQAEITNDAGEKVTWKIGNPVTISEANDWKWTFKDLYKYENGKVITYSVQESAIGETEFEGDSSTIIVYESNSELVKGKWEKSIDEFEITNTWTPATTIYTGSGEFYIEKLDQDGKVLSGVTFTVGNKTYTTGSDGKVKVEFSKSDEKPEDKYTFDITETEAPDYYDMIQGTEVLEATTNLDLDVDIENLTNTYTKTFTYEEKGAVNGYNWQENSKTLIVTNQALAKELKIEKTFEGITSNAFESNSSITFTVSGPKGFKETTLGIDDEECELSGNKITCVLSGSDILLPIGEYTVTESNADIENFTYESEPTDGKVSQTVGLGETAEFAIKNIYTPVTKEIVIKKTWDVTSGNLPTAAPTFITVELSNDKNTDKTIITLRGNGYGEWQSETLTVPAYDDNGDAISYEVRETGINAESNLAGDNNDTLYIYNGEALEGKWTAEQSEQLAVNNTWKPATSVYEGEASFEISKIDEKGRALAGVVFAVNGEDYTTDSDGNIKVEVKLSTTDAEEDQTFVISEKSTLEGYDPITGVATLEMTCKSVLKSVDEEKLLNTYTKSCKFEQNLNKTTNPAYDWNGETNTFTVVNNRSMADTLVIRKEISGVTGAALRNNGLKFTLTGPSDFETQEILFSEFTKIDDGVYEYNVEGKIPTGEYKVVESNAEFEGLLTLTVSGDNDVAKKLVSREDAVFTIKNEYDKIRDVTYSVAKIWDDANDKDGKRPGELEITLLRDGEEYRTVTLDEESDWVYEWNDLPRASEEAMEYTYSVVEAEVEDYESDGGEMVDGVFTFTNTHEPEPDLEPGYGGEVTPLTPETGKLTNMENGSSLSSVACGGIGIVTFASFGVIWVVARRKKNTTSNR